MSKFVGSVVAVLVVFAVTIEQGEDLRFFATFCWSVNAKLFWINLIRI